MWGNILCMDPMGIQWFLDTTKAGTRTLQIYKTNLFWRSEHLLLSLQQQQQPPHHHNNKQKTQHMIHDDWNIAKLQWWSIPDTQACHVNIISSIRCIRKVPNKENHIWWYYLIQYHLTYLSLIMMFTYSTFSLWFPPTKNTYVTYVLYRLQANTTSWDL